MSMYSGGAWTPDAPDIGLADDPAALIAANATFNPEELDRFEGIDTCGAPYADVVITGLDGQLRCDGDDGHYPDTPHTFTVTWYDSGDEPPMPPEPSCSSCADVGVTTDGPCDCAAGRPFREAANRARAAEVQP